MFYATFGLVVTSSVAIAGVLLVFSLLIIPAAIGMLLASSFAQQLVIGWTVGMLASAAGLALSFVLDLPTGATMVCVLRHCAGGGRAHPSIPAQRSPVGAARGRRGGPLGHRRDPGSLGHPARRRAARRPAAPRPAGARGTFGSLAVFFPNERAVHADATGYAERHRTAAEQLNELERHSRTQGEALDDFTVGRMSSLLKSYGEMRKGEQFVMNEVRGRARERARWSVSLCMLALALLLAPLPWRRLWARFSR